MHSFCVLDFRVEGTQVKPYLQDQGGVKPTRMFHSEQREVRLQETVRLHWPECREFQCEIPEFKTLGREGQACAISVSTFGVVR